ncbi:hypothetical protein BDY17DRAFT_153414 [Neohortaea acidophila]|uniref:Uncharacterized protein n=1 Tax=Neohortaea acidophila TaxID=245834 RepID=A0A6A6PWT7_9PEZI|nr:uncharacterized protein BDY17DRAFT_153414 [Neohortaea acidophila]KAF2483737.1 hypothetical protein BDY17DRAFT_153414 [Neohortaea acidophila]
MQHMHLFTMIRLSPPSQSAVCTLRFRRTSLRSPTALHQQWRIESRADSSSAEPNVGPAASRSGHHRWLHYYPLAAYGCGQWRATSSPRLTRQPPQQPAPYLARMGSAAKMEGRPDAPCELLVDQQANTYRVSNKHRPRKDVMSCVVALFGPCMDHACHGPSRWNQL